MTTSKIPEIGLLIAYLQAVPDIAMRPKFQSMPRNARGMGGAMPAVGGESGKPSGASKKSLRPVAAYGALTGSGLAFTADILYLALAYGPRQSLGKA